VKLHLPTYPAGIHQIDQELEPTEIGLSPDEFTHAIQAHLRLDRHDPYFDLRFKLDTTASAECDRCLTACDVPLSAEGLLLFISGNAPGEDVDDESIVYFKPGTTEVDLSSDFRDFLILAYSGRHLCREECLGLCPRCGSNLNEGPCTCQITLSK